MTQLSGVTQTCRTNRTGVANFSYLFELPLMFNLEVLQSEKGLYLIVIIMLGTMDFCIKLMGWGGREEIRNLNIDTIMHMNISSR